MSSIKEIRYPEIFNPDLVALGLGGTGMMAMLWTVAMGKQAVGVEMRGDPFLGVHWNIREDFYHQLGLIDSMMLERFGKAGVPKKRDGSTFRLSDCFFSTWTKAGDIVADQIIDGYDKEQHIVGTIHDIEYIDDRWLDGRPNRVVTILDPPPAPSRPEPAKIRGDVKEMLDGPSTFQASAASIQTLLRRYLEAIEMMDLQRNLEKQRVKLFTHHRVLSMDEGGFIKTSSGGYKIRIEELQEFDFKGKTVRVRKAGSPLVDLGEPELFVIAQGFDSEDAKKLGFLQKDVCVDHGDGKGSVTAQADFLAGLLEILVDGRLRRRISSEFDAQGNEHWVCQIAVGHENDPEVGWVLVQVPDFMTFDPIQEGLVPAGTCSNSPEYFAAYQQMLYEYYTEQVANILELSIEEVRSAQMVYGPKLFSLVERMGDDTLIAKNGVVAGDTFGNGHFLTSAGAMTGMIAHGSRFLYYWQQRAEKLCKSAAIRRLANSIKNDTEKWLEVSATEFSSAVPINFGAERIKLIEKASGHRKSRHSHSVDASRRQRHSLLPLDSSDWRRVFIRNGRVISHPLSAPRGSSSSMADQSEILFAA